MAMRGGFIKEHETRRSPLAEANARCYFKEHESHESIE